jgi:hypothetical protein
MYEDMKVSKISPRMRLDKVSQANLARFLALLPAKRIPDHLYPSRRSSLCEHDVPFVQLA